MKKAPEYQEYTWTIGAGESLEFARAAEFLVCLEASSPFKISFDHGTKTNFEAGLSFRVPQGFQRIRLENPGGASISVRLGFGRGDLRDARLVLDGAIKTEAVSPSSVRLAGPVDIPAGDSKKLVGVDAERREFGVKNMSTTARIWLRNSSALQENGWPLDPKEGVVLTVQDAIYAYNPSGGTVDLATFETVGD